MKMLKDTPIHTLVNLGAFLVLLWKTVNLELLCRLQLRCYVMEGHSKFNLTLLLLLMTVWWIQATFRRDEFTALEAGQNITEKVTEISTVNPMECIKR